MITNWEPFGLVWVGILIGSLVGLVLALMGCLCAKRGFRPFRNVAAWFCRLPWPPKLVAVSRAGSDPLVRASDAGFDTRPSWTEEVNSFVFDVQIPREMSAREICPVAFDLPQTAAGTLMERDHSFCRTSGWQQYFVSGVRDDVSLGSFRLKVPLGEPAEGLLSGYVWTSLEGPTAITPEAFGVLAAPNVACITNGTTFTATVCAHRLTVAGNPTESRVFTFDGASTRMTDLLRGTVVVRTETRSADEPDFVERVEEETFLAGRESEGAVFYETRYDSCKAIVNVWMYNEMSRRSFGRFAKHFTGRSMESQYMWWNWKLEVDFSRNRDGGTKVVGEVNKEKR